MPSLMLDTSRGWLCYIGLASILAVVCGVFHGHFNLGGPFLYLRSSLSFWRAGIPVRRSAGRSVVPDAYWGEGCEGEGSPTESAWASVPTPVEEVGFEPAGERAEGDLALDVENE